MELRDFPSRKNLLVLILCIGLIQIAAYYVSGMLATQDGCMAVPQPDTLLYCQAARRIVDGHPFSFSEGTAVSTGTTSILYPFLLAVPYALGATGDSLLTAGFLLNAAFYLVFLLGWGVAILEWVEEQRPRLVAMLLLSLAGQPAYCCMAQSDIGCWLAVSGLLAAGLARGRFLFYGPMLLLAPWIRPEGMICVFGYAVVLCSLLLFGRFMKCGPKVEKPGLKLGFLGLAFLSVMGVFAFNYLLTGHAQFSSVANKGYFKLLPFSSACYRTAADLLSMLKELALGSSSTLPRGLFSLPVLSGLFFLVGVFAFPWKNRKVTSLLIVCTSISGGILTVAYSGWQDTNMDRYISWSFPLLILFTAFGCVFLSNHMPPKTPRWLPVLALVLFSAGSSSVLWCIFHRSSTVNDLTRQFIRECEHVLPPHASIGGWGNCGVVYHLSPRRFAHICGIYSPEFQTEPHQAHSIAVLKYEPQNRFDYWFGESSGLNFVSSDKDVLLGEAVAVGPNGLELRKARWEAWNVAPLHVPSNLTLVASLRPAYVKDERLFSYEVIDRYGRPPTVPFIRTDTLEGRKLIECGRVLVGGDEMSIPLSTNRDLHVVMRTLPRQTADSYSGGGGLRSDEYAFKNPLVIRLRVDSQDLGPTRLSYATNGFSDVSFTIPAAAITKSPSRISFLGDHITCGYWFYQ